MGVAWIQLSLSLDTHSTNAPILSYSDTMCSAHEATYRSTNKNQIFNTKAVYFGQLAMAYKQETVKTTGQ